MMTERGTRRVNCNSKELKGGFLQHELWLGKKKKKQNRAWQLLDIRNKLRKNVKGRKKKENQFLEGVTGPRKFFISLEIMRILSKLPAPFR